jgi:hypothetical protein
MAAHGQSWVNFDRIIEAEISTGSGWLDKKSRKKIRRKPFACFPAFVIEFSHFEISGN